MLKTKFTVYTALTQAALLEALRRKDIYVALILSVVMILAASVIGTFGVGGLEIFIKDVTLTVVNLVTILLTVLFASRQVQEEVERRTVYPLLARPISRADFLVGKFCGAYTLSLLSLALFSFIGWAALTFYRLPVGTIFLQYLLLRAFALALVSALTLMLSLFMTSGATVTVALLSTLGSATFSQAVGLMDGTASSGARLFLRGSYFVFPHADLFDLSKRVSYGYKPVEAWVIGSLALYAAIYVTILVSIGVARFEKKAL